MLGQTEVSLHMHTEAMTYVSFHLDRHRIVSWSGTKMLAYYTSGRMLNIWLIPFVKCTARLLVRSTDNKSCFNRQHMLQNSTWHIYNIEKRWSRYCSCSDHLLASSQGYISEHVRTYYRKWIAAVHAQRTLTQYQRSNGSYSHVACSLRTRRWKKRAAPKMTSHGCFAYVC